MIPRRYRVFLWTGLILAINLLSIAVIDMRSGVFEVVTIGYLIGSLYAQATLAASWAALGPGHWLWRLPASLAWIFLLGLTLTFNLVIHGGQADEAVMIGLCFLAQWIMLQLPLGALKAGLRARLRYVDDTAGAGDQRPLQFGIRQLLVVTTIVGAVFGIGRVAVGTLLVHFPAAFDREVTVFLFLAGSAIVFSLPLLVAALLERWMLAGIAIALALIAGGTLWEAPLIHLVTGTTPRPNLWDLIAVNAFTGLLILGVAATVRCNGYSLTRSTIRAPAAAG